MTTQTSAAGPSPAAKPAAAKAAAQKTLAQIVASPAPEGTASTGPGRDMQAPPGTTRFLNGVPFQRDRDGTWVRLLVLPGHQPAPAVVRACAQARRQPATRRQRRQDAKARARLPGAVVEPGFQIGEDGIARPLAHTATATARRQQRVDPAQAAQAAQASTCAPLSRVVAIGKRPHQLLPDGTWRRLVVAQAGEKRGDVAAASAGSDVEPARMVVVVVEEDKTPAPPTQTQAPQPQDREQEKEKENKKKRTGTRRHRGRRPARPHDEVERQPGDVSLCGGPGTAGEGQSAVPVGLGG